MSPAEIDKLWTLLGQTWGAKFFEQYGARANEAWSSTLANVSPEAARHALRGLIQEGSAFPPTLPEFVAWAKKWRPVEVKIDVNGRPYMGDEPEIVRLQQRQVDPEVARQNLAKLRELIRG